jgi:WD40 repeat protein
LLYSSSGDSMIKVWEKNVTDSSFLTCVSTLKTRHTTVLCLAYDSTTGTLFSGSNDKIIHVWQNRDDIRREGLKCIDKLTGHQQRVECLNYDSTNCILYSGSSDKTIRVWIRSELESETMMLTCNIILAGHSWSIYCLVYSGNTLYTGSGMQNGNTDKTIKVWRNI